MRFKGIFAATASVALMAVSTMASAQTTAATAKATTEVVPAGENVQGSELRGGFIIPLIALIAIILGILAAIDHGDDLPHSP